MCQADLSCKEKLLSRYTNRTVLQEAKVEQKPFALKAYVDLKQLEEIIVATVLHITLKFAAVSR